MRACDASKFGFRKRPSKVAIGRSATSLQELRLYRERSCPLRRRVLGNRGSRLSVSFRARRLVRRVELEQFTDFILNSIECRFDRAPERIVLMQAVDLSPNRCFLLLHCQILQILSRERVE